MNQQDKFIDKLQTLSEGILAKLLTQTATTSRYLASEVVDLFSEFSQRNGRIVSSVDNIKKAQLLASKLRDIAQKSGYGQAIRQIVAEYAIISSAIHDYIATIVTFEKKDLYKQVLKSNIVTTVDLLANTGMQSGFIGPVTNLLQKNITGSTSIDQLKKMLRDQIAGGEQTAGMLNRYASVTATDAVEQFNRNYIEVISQDLKLEHFLYAGTIIKDSRDFCSARVGNYYTIAEIKSWSVLQWSGKNKATTKDNILTLLGGHGCRHFVIPVSKEVHDANR